MCADEQTNPTAPRAWFKVQACVVICVGAGIRAVQESQFSLGSQDAFPLLLALEACLGQRYMNV